MKIRKCIRDGSVLEKDYEEEVCPSCIDDWRYKFKLKGKSDDEVLEHEEVKLLLEEYGKRKQISRKKRDELK